MSVRRIKRKSKAGVWQETWMVDVTFEHPDGRIERVRKTSPVVNRRGAEEYERQLRASLLTSSRKIEEVPTLRKFAEEQWLPVYPHSAGNRPTTRISKEQHVRLHLLPVLGALRLDEIGTREIEVLYAGLRTKKKLRDKSVKNIGATLHRMLNSAVDWKLIDALPTFPRVKVPDPAFDHLAPDESTALVEAARGAEERALLLFALHSGARAGEQLAVEWGDIDWHNRFVWLRRSSSRGFTGPTKSGHHRRVPLTESLEIALRAIRHLKSKLVFCRADGSPYSLWMLHERLEGALRRAGLRTIRWHDLRHTFASQLVAAGVPLPQVQGWLGHGSIAMTMRYSHLAPSQGAELIARLERPRGNLTATAREVCSK